MTQPTTFGSAPAAAAQSDEPVHRARVEWASVPRVDLLPPEIRAARRFKHTQRRLGAAVALTLIAAVGATVWAQTQVDAAQSDLEAAQSQVTHLKSQQTQFADVPKVLSQLDAARAARASALGHDVLWYRYLDDLALASPSSTTLGSFSATVTDTLSPASNPLEATGLGTVTFAGKTSDAFPGVAQWLTSVSTVHGMDVSQLANASRTTPGGKVVDFSARVVLTPSALSHRYDTKVG